MFEQALAMDFRTTNKSWTMLVSLTGQCLAVGVACLLPLVFTDKLPRTMFETVLVGPPSAPPPPPPAHEQLAPRRATAARAFRPTGTLLEPARMPARAAIIEDEPDIGPLAGGIEGGIPGGIPGAVPGGIIGSVLRAAGAAVAPPPPPAAAAKEATPPPPPARIKVGGQVQKAMAIHQPTPVYPRLAITARIQGVVRLEGIIGTDGRIKALQVLSGHPLLVPAALEAVKTWVYRPTILNGDPVEVIAPIEVNFTLER